MTLTIPISDATFALLSAMARQADVDVEKYATALLEGLAGRKSFEELSGPVAEAFEQSGMSEDELETLVDSVKHEVRAERRLRRGA